MTVTTIQNPTDDQVRSILETTQTIAVVGWSDKEDRPSHDVAAYLAKQGYRVIPVNPRLEGREWMGEQIYGCVTDIPVHIDLIDVFRRPDFTPHHARKAVEAEAGVLWLQLGIVNDEAGKIALDGGLGFVQNRCTKIEHMRLIRGYPFPAPID